jgi:decaprenylphospho-beta-D-erythro-pentofuranosid-2-ulose 2-reductase
LKAVLLGATRGMGRALARQMAERGDRLFLLGRSQEDLERSASDLEIRGAAAGTAGIGKVGCARCDLSDAASFAPALDHADAALDGFDAVIVTAGVYATQETLENDPDALADLLQANFVGTIGFCEEARKRLLERGGGTLCVFSSVAGDRARKPVILYGAAKAGLSHYLAGIDHKFHGQGLRVVAVKPGFVRTGMTADLDPPPFAGEPESVARTVLAAIDAGRPVVYAPPIWRFILLAIRMLPRAVMRRLSF